MKKIISAAIVSVLLFAGCEPNVGPSASTEPQLGITADTVSGTPADNDITVNSEDNETDEDGRIIEHAGEVLDTGDGLFGSDDAEMTETRSEMNSSSAEEMTSEEAAVTPLSLRHLKEDENLNIDDNMKIGWGIGANTDKDNRPADAVSANGKYGDLGAKFIGENNKTIFLTFDEGYENGYTKQILDTLKKTGVKATFFVTYDYCRTAPDLVRRMIAEGHVVGNHSVTHPSFPSVSDSEVTAEVMKLHEYVKKEFGYEMKLFRFPMGEFSPKTLAQVKEMGYTSVFWSFAYQDWDKDNQPDAASAFDKIIKSTHNGEICLLHAVSETNANILGKVIADWTAKGYKLSLL